MFPTCCLAPSFPMLHAVYSASLRSYMLQQQRFAQQLLVQGGASTDASLVLVLHCLLARAVESQHECGICGQNRSSRRRSMKSASCIEPTSRLHPTTQLLQTHLCSSQHSAATCYTTSAALASDATCSSSIALQSNCSCEVEHAQMPHSCWFSIASCGETVADQHECRICCQDRSSRRSSMKAASRKAFTRQLASGYRCTRALCICIQPARGMACYIHSTSLSWFMLLLLLLLPCINIRQACLSLRDSVLGCSGKRIYSGRPDGSSSEAGAEVRLMLVHRGFGTLVQ
jgi:hypothetical protein